MTLFSTSLIHFSRRSRCKNQILAIFHFFRENCKTLFYLKSVKWPSWWSGKCRKRYSADKNPQIESPRNSSRWLWPRVISLYFTFLSVKALARSRMCLNSTPISDSNFSKFWRCWYFWMRCRSPSGCSAEFRRLISMQIRMCTRSLFSGKLWTRFY